ncbi:MAG TPA: cupin domain-containing protein [Chloroflexota bacterium]|jgi:hypothetical protein|nr:cupin domain-containing protein [Chloroflexota bacterium]
MSTQVAELHVKSFEVPDETVPIGDHVRVDTVKLGDVLAHRATFRPEFRWTEHLKPLVGTDLCKMSHLGYVISGRAGIRMANGTEREMGPGDAFDIAPGHDFWTVGDEPCVVVDFPPADSHTPPTS